MATYKRIDGDYNIISVGPSNGDNVNITTHTVNVTGNLKVTGNVTYIDVEKLDVEDPFITVAANNTGTIGTAVYQQQGLVAQTSGNTFAGLRFNNGTLTWQISPDVDANGAPITAYVDIVSGAGTVPGLPANSVQFNLGNVFTGSSNFLYDAATAKLTLQGHQVLGNIGTAPAAVANAVALYHNAEGAGGTGLYFRTTTEQDELVSRRKALVFSLIF